MDYAAEDILVVEDAIAFIRRAPHLFCGDKAKGASLAAAVLRDLIGHGDVPASVETVGDWWLVICQTDWLKDHGGAASDHWSRMIPTPEIGENSIRAEVVLAALARALVTGANGRLDWIVPATGLPSAVEARVNDILTHRFRGRLLAFLAD